MPTIDVKAVAQEHIESLVVGMSGGEAKEALFKERMRLSSLADVGLLAAFGLNEGNLPEPESPRRAAPRAHGSREEVNIRNTKVAYFRDHLLVALHNAEMEIHLSQQMEASVTGAQVKHSPRPGAVVADSRPRAARAARASKTGVFARRSRPVAEHLVVGCGHGHGERHERIHSKEKGWLSINAMADSRPDLHHELGRHGLVGTAYSAKQFHTIFFEGVPMVGSVYDGLEAMVSANLAKGGVVIINNIYVDSELERFSMIGLVGEVLIFADNTLVIAKSPETSLRAFFAAHHSSLEKVLDLECGIPTQAEENVCLADLTVLDDRQAFLPLKHLLSVCSKYKAGRDADMFRNHFRNSTYNNALKFITDGVKVILTDAETDPAEKLAEIQAGCQGWLSRDEFPDWSLKARNIRIVNEDGSGWRNMRDRKSVTANYNMDAVLRYAVGLCQHVASCNLDKGASYRFGAGSG